MSSVFYKRIRQALADDNLQQALDQNAWRRNSARMQVFSSLPEGFKSMRQRAHQIRAEVIAHLEEYVAQFEERARRNGFHVHRAAHADEAVGIFLNIAQAHHAQLIVKSKTMVSEEIGLNIALEGHGMRVVESDLGEYIVQLREEHPAHLVTPAVHLTRQQVGKTFQEKLGVPYTEDVAEMTAVARRTLRQIFLQADIGVSGVNFGVAENGMICLLTNEGNGRMVTTLPRVHVALMGLERLVPTMEDLALMLYLLPRSATGQKMTVYASLMGAPAEGGDGPKERHIILLDNGRLALKRSPLYEALYCIRCAACLNACPVFRELSGHAYVGRQGEFTPYVGPIGAVLSPAMFGYARFAHLARASSLCGACQEVCPVGIDLPRLLLRVRAGQHAHVPVAHKPRPRLPWQLVMALKLFAWMAESAKRFHAGISIATWLSRLFYPRSPWMRLPAFTQWGLSRDLPRPARHPFRRMWKEIMATEAVIQLDTMRPSSAEREESASHRNNVSARLSLLDRFADEWRALNGIFIACERQSLAARILEVLQEAGETSLQAWQEEHLPPGLCEELTAQGIHIVHTAQEDIRVGLTGAAYAVAESGTLVLPCDQGRGPSISLLPEIHLAVLEARKILPDLFSAFSRLRTMNVPSIVLVSGPSRTADIEMTLTVGVHGPCKAIVFCLLDASD